MKFKLIFTLFLAALLNYNCPAQNQTVQPLTIGDRIPDFLLKNLLNNKTSTAKAADFYHHGLLIINFWATWCIPCVRTFPYLDSTMAKYPNTVRMICVTVQPKEEVTKFLTKNKGLGHLVFATDEHELIKYFPHSSIPHNVWIDKNGIIKAITDDDEIVEDHINNFLAGKTDLYVKKDQAFDWQKPLAVADTEFLYRSVFTKIKDEIGTAGLLMPDSLEYQTRFMVWNLPKTFMIWAAYMKTTFSIYDYKLMEIHAKDTSSYYLPSHNREDWKDSLKMKAYQLWRHQNLYCYEISFRKKVNLDTFYSIAKEEIAQLLNISVKIEKRETNCWVITKLSNGPITPESSNLNPDGLHATGSSIIATRQTLNQIATVLTRQFDQEAPFVDQTGISYPIDINYNYKNDGESLNIKPLKRYLNSIGLDITLQKALYPHLIVYDLN